LLACRGIGDNPGRHLAPQTGVDRKSTRGLLANSLNRDAVDPCQWGAFKRQSVDKIPGVVTLDFDDDTVRIVRDETGQAITRGETIYVWTKADALNGSPDAYA